MRLADRLTRLETRAGSAMARMTAGEIDAAVATFAIQVAEEPADHAARFWNVPSNADVLPRFRALVEGTRPPLQQVYAAMQPVDLAL